MDSAESPQDRLVLDLGVACQPGIVGHHHLTADVTVVGHVRIGHEEVVVADRGDPVLVGCPVDGDALAQLVAVANPHVRALAAVGKVLRRRAEDCVREDHVL